MRTYRSKAKQKYVRFESWIRVHTGRIHKALHEQRNIRKAKQRYGNRCLNRDKKRKSERDLREAKSGYLSLFAVNFATVKSPLRFSNAANSAYVGASFLQYPHQGA